ncbi:hypothetical protein CHU98_g11248, partial [Xylaria longipes]
ADTKGLYRVHEFTKVELFAWTAPDVAETTDVFDEMVDAQTEILASLGLHCRVLEMPSSDLGASAIRKIDIEAFFPSRAAQGLNDGWGEVTSASICTDYQSRRLATRMRGARAPRWRTPGPSMGLRSRSPASWPLSSRTAGTRPRWLLPSPSACVRGWMGRRRSK